MKYESLENVIHGAFIGDDGDDEPVIVARADEGLREFETRAAAAATEARLLKLRTASLQDENGRLRVQLEELDDARAKEKLRAIKARVQAEREESRREEAALRARVAELESCGRGGSEEEERVAALEAEAAALRQANAAATEESSSGRGGSSLERS